MSRQTNSPGEAEFARVLDAQGIPYIPQHKIGHYHVDFYIPKAVRLNGQRIERLIIEVDSRYWHSLPGKKARDRKRDAYLRFLGYTVVRVSELKVKELVSRMTSA